MELNSGMVIAVPIPESRAPLGAEIEISIREALQDAECVFHCVDSGNLVLRSNKSF